MNLDRKNLGSRILSAFIAVIFLASCQTPTSLPTAGNTQLSPTAASTSVPDPFPTPAPTEISVPMAVLVNGEGIPLEYFDGEVSRYRLALEGLEQTLPEEVEIRAIVRNDLVDQLLLAQAAYAGGFTVSEEDIEARILSLAAEMGGQEVLDAWLLSQNYSPESFRWALKLSLASGWQKEQIITAVPEAVEQVHARQVFAYTEAGANRALTSLNSGTDFDKVAWDYSPETGGELGWFPRGYLTVPQVEEIAFTLPIGEYSQIIESELGYHIIMVMEKDSQRLLTNDARQTLQRQALQTWLETTRTAAQIEVLVP